MKAKERKKASNAKSEIPSIGRQLRQLSDNLEVDLSRRKKEQKRRDYGAPPFDQRVHEYKIEAGRLLAKAHEMGGLQRLGGLQRIIGSRRRSVFNPDFGHSSAFEVACLKWIPRRAA